MPKCKYIEYIDNYLKTSATLWLYCRDKPALNNDGTVIDFGDNNTTVLFKLIEKISGQTGNDGTKSIEIMIPLKCLSNFGKPLICI